MHTREVKNEFRLLQSICKMSKRDTKLIFIMVAIHACARVPDQPSNVETMVTWDIRLSRQKIIFIILVAGAPHGFYIRWSLITL